ncbi:GDSL-type esterase/lipase family protein [Spartinivicinus ruber]|uniref:GDSL-type esterase/lipase family protein n=1 Tax=Spartinivicinus ruber TaxID=2683272 RepID=UPI0013D2B9BC|nr:GDSL-type esterase/lipase family protein [Spartinivicinus ruber]
METRYLPNYKTVFMATFCLAVGLSYGMASIQYEFFPYSQIIWLKKSLFPEKKVKPFSKGYSYYYNRKVSFFSTYTVNARNVMLGDSITDDAEWHELLPGYSIVNRGIAGDTIAGTLNRLDVIPSDTKQVFLMLGTNDIIRRTPFDEMVKNYQIILARLQARGITPIIQSTLFFGERFKPFNLTVTRLNDELLALAKNFGIQYIDLNERLAPDGVLEAKYTIDGIHLYGAGYIQWQQVIEPILEK